MYFRSFELLIYQKPYFITAKFVTPVSAINEYSLKTVFAKSVLHYFQAVLIIELIYREHSNMAMIYGSSIYGSIHMCDIYNYPHERYFYRRSLSLAKLILPQRLLPGPMILFDKKKRLCSDILRIILY